MTILAQEIEKPTIFVAPISKWMGIEKLLTRVINRGYDKPRYKYNIILTPRIQDGLIQDFVIDDNDNAIFALCVIPASSRNIQVEEKDDKNAVTKKLIRNYPIGNLNLEGLQVETNVTQLLTDSSLKTLEGRILGTVCLKNYSSDKHGLEITGFTSFYPKLSPQLLKFVKIYSYEQLKAQKLWVEVIQEHDLVPYYEKQGFTLLDTILCVVDTKTQQSSDQPLEDGIKASRDFHVALMSMSTTVNSK